MTSMSSQEALGDALLSAWLDSLLTGLERFLETSGAKAAASGSGFVCEKYQPLLSEHSERLRKVSLQLAAAADSPVLRHESAGEHFEGTSSAGGSRMDEPLGQRVSRLTSGRAESHQRAVSRFFEADLLSAETERSVFESARSRLRAWVRSPKQILHVVQTISFLATFYTLVATPYIVGFRRIPSPGVSLAEVCCEITLLVNLAAPFCCGLPDPDTQKWISSPRTVIMMYACGWLVVDLLAAIPWHIMWLIVGDEALLAFSLLRLVLLPKLISQFVFGDFHQSSSFLAKLHPNLLRVVKLISFFFLVVHMIACGYSAVGSGASSKWAIYAQEQPLPLSEWTNAYYWAFCGILGENMEPQGYAETAFNCAAMAAGVLLNSCIVGSATAALGALDERASKEKSKLDAITTFLNRNSVSPEVCDQVQQYYQYLGGSVTANIDGLFDELTASLRLKLSLCLHKKFVKSCHLFVHCPPDCVVSLVGIITKNHTLLVPCELLFKKGAPGDSMYFVSKGEVLLYDPGTVLDESTLDFAMLRRLKGQRGSRGAFLIDEFKAGDFFGDSALMEEDNRREGSATAMTFTELLSLPRRDFDGVAKRYPEFLHEMVAFRKIRTSSTTATVRSSSSRNSFLRRSAKFTWDDYKAKPAERRSLRRFTALEHFKDHNEESSGDNAEATNISMPGVPSIPDAEKPAFLEAAPPALPALPRSGEMPCPPGHPAALS